MCGIAGVVSLTASPVPRLRESLLAMERLLRHRGPDGHGLWTHARGHVGFVHRRLAVIDLDSGQQPMSNVGGDQVVHNGEIYNYVELREQLGLANFRTASDTEVLLHGHDRWGLDFLDKLRGMFAFALWNEQDQSLLCARDPFGIKPLYYTVVNDILYFASEVKALLPFLPDVSTDIDALKDYLTFQFCLAGKTLFRGVRELEPAHFLRLKNGSLEVRRYWEVYYSQDFDHTPRYFEETLRDLVRESVRLHLRSDVPIGAYISGGLDSSIVASAATQIGEAAQLMGFHGTFDAGNEYDERIHARAIAEWCGFPLEELAIQPHDFTDQLRRVVYHLDYPTAGPGSFSQFMVSGLAAKHRKVVLGGQGGDEIFGGYVRYLIAYFEQCLKAAIDGTMHNGNFVVTYESIIPNLSALRNYKALMQEFWRDGLFEEMDRRYFRLINRAPGHGSLIRWKLLGDYSPFETFKKVFDGDNVGKQSYFDRMTHFDFKTLLPALLHVEDRVSMAHGLESRVPLLDRPLVEFAATIPADVKFQAGTMKHLLKRACGPLLPPQIVARTDKMGFPTPLTEWMTGEGREFVDDLFSSRKALERDFIDNRAVRQRVGDEKKFGRSMWGLMCLEIWQTEFHDRADEFRRLVTSPAVVGEAQGDQSERRMVQKGDTDQ